MKTKNIYISDLHFDHKRWANQLKFAKEEVLILEHRLEEIAARNTATEVMAEVEHFQNQFIRHKEVIDEYLHEIKMHEESLVDFAKEHPVALEHRHFEDHGKERENMESFNKIFAELREEFNRFLAKWM